MCKLTAIHLSIYSLFLLKLQLYKSIFSEILLIYLQNSTNKYKIDKIELKTYPKAYNFEVLICSSIVFELDKPSVVQLKQG